jgi:hypothetical protein
VLRDAVAARKRRRVVDAVLLALLLALAWHAPALVLAWAVVAVPVSFASISRKQDVSALLWVGGGLALLLLIIGPTIVPFLKSLLWQSPTQTSDASAVLPVILTLVVLIVVLVHELVVAELIRTDLSSERFVPDPRPLPASFSRSLRTAGLLTFGSELRRVADAERRAADRNDVAEVVAYRGEHPFIGAGRLVRDESLTIPLERDEDSEEEPLPFTPSDLYEHVDAAILRLRGSASLAPSQRLSELAGTEVVLVPVEHLLRNAPGDLTEHLLPDPDRPPIEWMPRQNARLLADHPLEIARYVRRYRLEAWDRDIATSTFFHVGTDGRMLFVEWAHCVLFPIRAEYRAIDDRSELHMFVEAARQAVTLPVALVARVPLLFGSLGPHRRSREITRAERYGAGLSIREHASAGRVDSHYQHADAIRYVGLLEQAIFSAISSFLRERNYSVEDVLGVAKARINNSMTFNNSTVTNSAVGNTKVRQSSGPDRGSD